MARLEIRMLGGFEVRLGGQLVAEFESVSCRALLARLASEPGHLVARTQLAELLWPERPEGKALANLRHSLSIVRRAIGDHGTACPALVSVGSRLMIDPVADVWIDVADLLRLAGTPPTQMGAMYAWEQAAELWTGPFLDGFDGRLSTEWDAWVRTFAAAVDGAACSALRQLADRHRGAGRPEAAIDALRSWTRIDPWNELAHRQLFRELAVAGDRAGALAAAEEFRFRIRHELETGMTAETETLIDNIRHGRPTGATRPWGPGPHEPQARPPGPLALQRVRSRRHAADRGDSETPAD